MSVLQAARIGIGDTDGARTIDDDGSKKAEFSPIRTVPRSLEYNNRIRRVDNARL